MKIGDYNNYDINEKIADAKLNVELIGNIEPVDSFDNLFKKDGDVDQYKNLSLEEINNLTVKELQGIARKNNLKIKGKKDELLERVKVLYNLNVNMK